MEFAKRKHPRLKAFDYSQSGCYYVTICTKNKQALLSHVGRGLAHADRLASSDMSIQLTTIGQTVEHELLGYPE